MPACRRINWLRSNPDEPAVERGIAKVHGTHEIVCPLSSVGEPCTVLEWQDAALSLSRMAVLLFGQETHCHGRIESWVTDVGLPVLHFWTSLKMFESTEEAQARNTVMMAAMTTCLARRLLAKHLSRKVWRAASEMIEPL